MEFFVGITPDVDKLSAEADGSSHPHKRQNRFTSIWYSPHDVGHLDAHTGKAAVEGSIEGKYATVGAEQPIAGCCVGRNDADDRHARDHRDVGQCLCSGLST